MSIYKIDQLIDTFHDHAKQAAKDNAERLQEFKQNFPGEPVPEHFYELFSLPVALAAMCEAIVELQKQVKKD